MPIDRDGASAGVRLAAIFGVSTQCGIDLEMGALLGDLLTSTVLLFTGNALCKYTPDLC